jgi:hypothetical protein
MALSTTTLSIMSFGITVIKTRHSPQWQSIAMLNVFMLNVFMLNVFMLNVFMLNVFMLNVFMVSVVAPILDVDKHSSLLCQKMNDNIGKYCYKHKMHKMLDFASPVVIRQYIENIT